MKLELHIPRPPSVNGLYANRSGGRYKTRRYTKWLAEAGYALSPQIRGHKTLTAPCSVALVFDKRRGDLDNYVKGPFDLLTRHRVWLDDDQVEQILLRHDRQAGGIMFVTIDAKE